MASICGGTLALLDAGVPLTEPAAGVAVGLITRQENANVTEHKVLLDILGLEDYLGDMDFKLGGTRSGITTLQSDVKIPGLPYHIIAEAMKTGRKGISDVLDIMSEYHENGGTILMVTHETEAGGRAKRIVEMNHTAACPTG